MLCTCKLPEARNGHEDLSMLALVESLLLHYMQQPILFCMALIHGIFQQPSSDDPLLCADWQAAGRSESMTEKSLQML